ncbi:MAG: hypothetical protein JSV04_00755 [Candidatus Heimdallarchaeota archaeon]|nr:MAG: hypothetical protein JSV04_00755 [Candidatus Heimdallarchaeota archaeon]
MEETPKTQEIKPKKEKDYIKVRGYPETLFFYPSMLVAFIVFMIYFFADALADMGFILDDSMKSALGTFFFAVFAFNFIIVAFDFGLGKTALIAAIVIIAILIYLLLRTQEAFQETLSLGFDWPEITASMEFYFFFAALVFIHLIIIYIYSRIDYWLISPTEIYHHRGILGDEKRFGNAQHAHIEKTTPDIFEKMLFLSGDLFIKPETDPHIYRISNVFRANKKESEIRNILSYVPDKRLDL